MCIAYPLCFCLLFHKVYAFVFLKATRLDTCFNTHSIRGQPSSSLNSPTLRTPVEPILTVRIKSITKLWQITETSRRLL